MKKSDILFILCLLILFLPFFLIAPMMDWYSIFNREHGLIMSFLKFAILATSGEMLGLRIKTGNYYASDFGPLPRAIIWGLIGITIKIAFIIFTKGTIAFLMYMGFTDSPAVFAGTLSLQKVMVAFCISASMNIIYAPVMMTFHRMTDTHIARNGGSLRALVTPLPAAQILGGLNWKTQWSFVFARTIPLFWIPAHTITFLLPEAFQVLFAALLGIALGVIMALAARMSTSKG